MILNELLREDLVKLNIAKMDYYSALTKIVVKGPGDAVMAKMFEENAERMLLAFQRAGQATAPWDGTWLEIIKATEKRLRDKIENIGAAGISTSKLVELIKAHKQLIEQNT